MEPGHYGKSCDQDARKKWHIGIVPGFFLAGYKPWIKFRFAFMGTDPYSSAIMAPIRELFQALSHWMSPYLWHICLAMSATILAIYGSSINEWLRKTIKGYHFLLRVTIFVVVCAFGYGLLSMLLAKALAALLEELPSAYLSPVVIGAFVAVGILAERHGHI